MKSTVILLGIFSVLFFETTVKAQNSYNVEKCWGLQFKLPQEVVGNLANSKVNFWLTGQQEGPEFEFYMQRMDPASFPKRFQKLLEETQGKEEDFSEHHPEGLQFQKTQQFGLVLEFAEISKPHRLIIFTFAYEGKKYLGYLLTKSPAMEEIAQAVLRSIQPV
ncbi:MAG: hypothetical protein HC913_02180 [Microscillaceae bacterium]|nr:hypothetical protein [Microscillaceae bacterium]